MRKLVQLVVFALFMGSGVVFAQYITAEDNAGNYSTWTNGSNQGFGFGAWDMWITSSAGFFLGSSSSQGFGNIDTDSKAFGMYGNPPGDYYSNAQRLVNNWADGATFTINIATAYRNGSKGIDVFASGFENVWNFNVGSDKYTAGGVDQSWDYSQTSIFILTVTQNGSNIQISLTRGSDSYSTTINNKTFYAFKFYSGSANDGNALNNLYFNSMQVEYSDPSKVPSSADVKINGNVELASDQSLTVKNLTITSGNSFTLESLPTGTASLITTGTITGNVTIERYLTGGYWHFLSSPVVDQPIVGASNFIAFTFGTGGNEGDPNVDFFRYDETATTDPWINIKGEDGTLNTSFGTPSSDPHFVEGQGYLVSYQTAEITKIFVGVPFTGPLLIPLTYTEAGSKGWNLVGNPYPSAIDWDAGIITKTNLFNEYYYIYNQEMNSGGGGYEYFSTSMAGHSDGVNGDIPAMQAFFVKAASGGGSLTLSNNARKHSTQPFLKDELNNSNLIN